MSPQQTATPLDVAAAMERLDRVLADQYRSLARHGRTDLIDAIYDGDVPRLLMGSSPRMERGA